MKLKDFKRVYDRVQLSKEADARILEELLKEGDVQGKVPGGSWKRRKYVYVAAAVIVLVFVSGVIFVAGRMPGFGPSGTKVAVHKGDKDRRDTGEEENQKKKNDGEGEKTETPRPSIKTGKGWKQGYEPKEFQVQPVPYPMGDEIEEDLPEIEEGYLENLLPFYKKSFQSMLTGKKGENQLYSPINLYFTLAMMAEMTAGESRGQIMEALGQKELEKVRKQSESIWQWLYSDKKNSRCILGNSLWAKQGALLNEDTLRTLSDNYYASTYQGQMGSKAYDRTIQDWLNKMTGGNLKKYVGEIETSENTSLMLLSAADFYGTWVNHAIDERNTKKGTFYAGSGKKVSCDFMTSISDSYFYKRKGFTASGLGLSGGRKMYIFLPDKDSSVEELLQRDIEEVLHISAGTQEDTKAVVTMQFPKFQIDSEKDTVDTMKRLGVKDIFLPESADFSGLLGNDGGGGCYVGKASQAMQVSIDEKGCSVSAYSQTTMFEKGLMPSKEKKMRCDRPFLFVISDRNGIPIFAGVVNQPKK